MPNRHPSPVLHVRHDEADAARSLVRAVREGLLSTPKWLSPTWLYDARGSDLFEQITRLPEYYPAHAEREILQQRGHEFAEITGAQTFVELGSGSSAKTRILLDALSHRDVLSTFVPVDVSETALHAASTALAVEYPRVSVRGLVGDFTGYLGEIPGEAPRTAAVLGGTIGNLDREGRAALLHSLRKSLGTGSWLLLGIDLVKDPTTLVRAYDDAQGVTAEFNRNVLRVLNRELDGDFVVDAYCHVAVWNTEREQIEMRLRAQRAMRVGLPGAGVEISFAEGEELCTETSAKFRRSAVEEELGATGFTAARWWTDAAQRYALVLARGD